MRNLRPSKHWRPRNYKQALLPALAVVLFGGLGVHFLTDSHAATVPGGAVQLYITPATGSVTQGQQVSFVVHVKTNGAMINAVGADVTYPSSLTYVSTTSACVDPPFGVTAESSNSTGLVKIACGSIAGVNGDFAVGTITFTANAGTGTAALAFANTSEALAQIDNANVLGSTTGASVNLTLPAPTVTAVAPATGSSAGGTAVTITGTSFSGTPTVTFGGAAATGVSLVNATTITATTPAGNAGASTVAVTINSQTATKAAAFTYTDTTAPSKPGTPTATATEMYRVALSWTASTDSGGSGVAGYKVYRDGTLLTAARVNGTTYSDDTAQPLTTYIYTVEAIDGAGNVSPRSAGLSVTTRRKGDTNNDGAINLTDLSRLLSKFGQTVAAGTGEDIDRSGKVDLTDLSILLTNYGK